MSEPKPITTEAELRASGIEEREKAATPGPWRPCRDEVDGEGWWGQFPSNSPECLVMTDLSLHGQTPICCTNDDGLATEAEFADAVFITHARQDIPLLVASLREFLRREAALRAEIERMLEVAKGFKGENGSTLADFLGSATQQAGENSEMERG